ncbi:MAG: hypothetical protein K1000chlam3_00544 [Chlamydiae bacterium]|nr:hypothetical protein [Chlamydiota bacterium]
MKFNAFIFLLVIECSILNAAEKSIGLLIKDGFRGEISFAYRIKSACNNIGWKADVINIKNSEELESSEHDFVVSLVPGSYKHPKCKNYLAIFHPLHHYFKRSGLFRKKYRSFDGYLLTYSPNAFGSEKKNFTDNHKFPYMSWYPTVQRLKYHTTNPAHLFHICCQWGNRFMDDKFKECLSLLDRESYTRLYGSPLFQEHYPYSYRGEISYDDDSLHEIASQAGIILVLHSSEHNAYGLPSGRIFEATAASAVIICDQNSFVKDNFGDSVLYINTDEDGQSIYNQIQRHMEWIIANKAQALEKAKRAHAIYEEKFLLENQLLKLEEFHNRLMNKPKNRIVAWLQAIGS